MKITLKPYKLFWEFSHNHIKSSTSFGMVHISLPDVTLTVLTPFGTINMFPEIKDISLLQRKVESLHLMNIETVHNLWTKIVIKN